MRAKAFPYVQALLLAIIASAGAPVQPVSADQPLTLESTIPLAGVSGRIDHMAIDLPRRRLIVAELGNDTVDVVDLAAGHVQHRIAGLAEPQGTAYVPGADLIVVANGGDGSLRFFHAGDFTPAGQVALGSDADNVRIAPGGGTIFAGYGSGGIAMIDPATLKSAGTIALPAHPESFQVSRDGARAFVNVPDTQRIAVLDLKQRRLVTEWRIPGLRANFPMALDQPGTMIATIFRSPARLVLLDIAGTVRANMPVCGDADDVFFDDRRGRLYVSCGQGAVDVVAQQAGGYEREARIESARGARTALYVPELDRMFVAAPARGSEAARILVFRPRP